MSKILLAGNDLRLLSTRAPILAKTKASVVSCNAMEAMTILETEIFDLVVLCHSLTEKQAVEITEVVHRRLPKTRVLMIVSDISQERSDGQLAFDETSSPYPDDLIRRTSELLTAFPNHRIEESPRVRE